MNAHLLTPDSVAAASAQFAAAPLLAVDTEFHTEGRFAPELLLVQVHVPGGDTWLIDPLVPGLLPSVGPALLGGSTWLVHSGLQDLRLLATALGGVATTVLDTQIAAGLVGTVYPAGLADISERWLGRRPEKSSTMSDWSRRPLTAEQVAYAAEDVVELPRLWDALAAGAASLGRTDAVLAACDEARTGALTPPDPNDRWRDIASGGDPDRQEAAVLCALVAWRDEQARRSDRPPNFILGDGTLRQLGRARPTHVEQIAANRRISPKTVDRYGRALIEVIAKAVASDPATWPDPIRRDAPAARVADMLELTTTVCGQAGAFATRLVLPRKTAESLARRPGDSRALLAGWRDALLGDVVRDVLDGRGALVVRGGELRFDRDFRSSCPQDVSQTAVTNYRN